MSVFVDTNILLRSIQPSDPSHQVAVRAITTLIEAGEVLMVTPQVLAEFWYAATRPREKNGLGLSIEKARQELAQLEAFFTVIGESPEVYQEWKNSLVSYRISGIHAHDARLVAAMKVHGIARILTFDVDDFSRYDVEVIHPNTV